MAKFSSMPPVGLAVIVVILSLFVLSLCLLFRVWFRYRGLANCIAEGPERDNAFLRSLVNEFASAYKENGKDVNTPAIVAETVHAQLGEMLLCERFLSNAVSLFVTLGLFGTFAGLSLSVSSLTELISYTNTSEWLSVLDSVGGGLMSSLSGMGVAFYTSLVGVACSILLTIFRSVFSPAAQREVLENRAELWLDRKVAPSLPTDAPKDEADMVKAMIRAMNGTAEAVDASLKKSSEEYSAAMKAAAEPLDGFSRTVKSFNGSVRDFKEFDYNLRGTVERLDLCVRDLTVAVRRLAAGREEKQ